MMREWIAFGIMALLSGCARFDYAHTTPTGDQYKVSGWTFGNTSTLAGLKIKANKDGNKELKIDALSQDQTEALSAVVEGAVKGAAAVVKP